MDKEYDNVIIGCSMAGLGIALKHENTLIIDRGAVPGFEFFNALKHGSGYDNELNNKAAIELKEDLIKRNILADAKVTPAAVVPVLFDIIKRRKLNVLFWSEPVGVEPDGAGYVVSFYNASGISTVKAARVIDTTAECVSATEKCGITGKRINALLNCTDNQDFNTSGLQPAAVVDCRFASEKIVSLPLASETTWVEARKQLIAFWKQRPDDIQSWLIASTAYGYDFEVSSAIDVIDDNWLYWASAGYDNPLAAFDAGLSFE